MNTRQYAYIHEFHVNMKHYPIEKGLAIVIQQQEPSFSLGKFIDEHGPGVFDTVSSLLMSVVTATSHESHHNKGANASTILLKNKIKEQAAAKEQYLENDLKPRELLIYTPVNLMIGHVSNSNKSNTNVWLVSSQSPEDLKSQKLDIRYAMLCFSPEAAEQLINNINVLMQQFGANIFHDLLNALSNQSAKSIAVDDVYKLQLISLFNKQDEILKCLITDIHLRQKLLDFIDPLASVKILDLNQFISGIRKMMIIERSNDERNPVLYGLMKEFFSIYFDIQDRYKENMSKANVIITKFEKIHSMSLNQNINKLLFRGELNDDMNISFKKYYRDSLGRIFKYCADNNIPSLDAIRVANAFIGDLASLDAKQIYNQLPKRDLYIPYKELKRNIDQKIDLTDIDTYVNTNSKVEIEYSAKFNSLK